MPYDWPPPEWLEPEPEIRESPFFPPNFGTELAMGLIDAPPPQDLGEPLPPEPNVAQLPAMDLSAVEAPDTALEPTQDEFPPPAWGFGQEPNVAQLPAMDLSQVEAPDTPLEDNVVQLPPLDATPDPLEEMAQSERRIGALKSQSAELVADQSLQQARDQQAGADQAQRESMEVEKRTQAKMGALRQEIADLSQAQIDPGRRFRDAGTGEKIAWYVSAAIGGYLNPGGKNTTIDMIQTAIDRDIDAQMTDLENRRFGIGKKMTLLQEEIAAGNDAYTAKLKHYAATLENAAMQTRSQALKIESPIGQMEAEKTAAGLIQSSEAAKAQLEVKAREDEYKRLIEEDKLRIDRERIAESAASSKRSAGVAIRGQNLDSADKAADREARRAIEGGKVAIPGISRGGKPALAPTEKEGQELRALVGSTTGFVQGLDRLTEIYGAAGWESSNLGSEGAKEAESILADLQQTYAVIKKQGAISDGDRKSYDKIFGKDATGVYDMRTKWKSMRDRRVMDVNNTARALIGQDIDPWEPSSRPKGAVTGGTVDTQGRRDEEGNAVDAAGRYLPVVDPATQERQDREDGLIWSTADSALTPEQLERKRELRQKGWK